MKAELGKELLKVDNYAKECIGYFADHVNLHNFVKALITVCFTDECWQKL